MRSTLTLLTFLLFNSNLHAIDLLTVEELKKELLEHVPLKLHVVKADFTFSLEIQAEANKLKLIHNEREKFGERIGKVG